MELIKSHQNEFNIEVTDKTSQSLRQLRSVFYVYARHTGDVQTYGTESKQLLMKLGAELASRLRVEILIASELGVTLGVTSLERYRRQDLEV